MACVIEFALWQDLQAKNWSTRYRFVVNHTDTLFPCSFFKIHWQTKLIFSIQIHANLSLLTAHPDRPLDSQIMCSVLCSDARQDAASVVLRCTLGARNLITVSLCESRCLLVRCCLSLLILLTLIPVIAVLIAWCLVRFGWALARAHALRGTTPVLGLLRYSCLVTHCRTASVAVLPLSILLSLVIVGPTSVLSRLSWSTLHVAARCAALLCSRAALICGLS